MQTLSHVYGLLGSLAAPAVSEIHSVPGSQQSAMWHVIYLSLFNVFIGVTSSVIVRRRADWVRRQTEQGYDFKETFPAKLTDRLPFLKPKEVDIRDLCAAIDPEYQFCASDLEIIELETPVEAVDEAANLGEPTDASAVASNALDPTTSDALEEEVVEPDFNAEDQSEPVSEADANGPESTMEVIDLQGSNVSDLEDVSDEVGDDPEFDEPDSDSVTADGSDNKIVEPISDRSTATSDAENPSGQSTENDSIVVGKMNSEPADENEAAEIEGDFLQRISLIERSLQQLLDEEDCSPGLNQPSQQLMDAANYWEAFRDSAQAVLTSQSAQGNDPTIIQSIDDVIQQVDREVEACQELATQASLGNTGADPVETTNTLRSHVLQAAKGSHQLRDQLSAHVANRNLKFTNCTPHQLLDYSEGLCGLEEVIHGWTIKNEDSFAGLGIIDIDQFDQVNRDFGLKMSDHVLARCCEQINNSIRHNRGYDRLVRVGGQQFLIFFGYTTGKDVCYALERIRQSFAHTDFEIRGELTHLDIRSAAIDYQPNQNPMQHLQVLRQGLAKAKELGGNNVVCGSFETPFDIVDGMPDYDLPIRSIEVDDQTVAAG